jgi:hypothetical protein
MMLFLLICLSAAWGAAGFSLCTSRHRQKGMEVDRLFDMPVDLLPQGGIFVEAK